MEAEYKIVEFDQVHKRFGSTRALDGVDLTVGRGMILGLVGANGCGKSTLIRHIVGLYLPDEGTITTLGCEARRLGPDRMARLGYVHQEGQLLDWMTVRQHLAYVAAYYDHWNLELQNRFLEQFDIDLKARVGKLSPGKRQQLAILLAICHEPELLILDEPASALDPIARGRFFDLLLELIQERSDRTILISSHILSDIEKVVDQVVVMDRGRIRRNESLDALRERYCRLQMQSLPVDETVRFENSKVLDAKYASGKAQLLMENLDEAELRTIIERYDCPYEISPLSLDEIYEIVVSQPEEAA